MIPFQEPHRDKLPGLPKSATPHEAHTPDHGPHKVYRCAKCFKPVTYEMTKSGCFYCGSQFFTHASYLTDAEFKWAVQRGFDPQPDAWNHQKDDLG